jgi:RNA polymerase sigma-70 factor, ECF subfamily
MSGREQTDEELIAGFKETGQSCFLDKLVGRHAGIVRSMIYPMVFNNADADDLTQEVFIRAVKGLDRFEGRACFRTWLYRIAMNTTHHFLAKRRKQHIHEGEPETDCPAPEKDHPDRRAMAGELDRAISCALEALAPTLRAAIMLTILQDIPILEAARIEDCSPATMYWRIHKARRRLREELGRYLS